MPRTGITDSWSNGAVLSMGTTLYRLQPNKRWDSGWPVVRWHDDTHRAADHSGKMLHSNMAMNMSKVAQKWYARR